MENTILTMLDHQTRTQTFEVNTTAIPPTVSEFILVQRKSRLDFPKIRVKSKCLYASGFFFSKHFFSLIIYKRFRSNAEETRKVTRDFNYNRVKN